MKAVMDEGEEMEYGPGDFVVKARTMTRGSWVRNPVSSLTGRASLTMPSAEYPGR
jgi:hypothetical protein